MAYLFAISSEYKVVYIFRVHYNIKERIDPCSQILVADDIDVIEIAIDMLSKTLKDNVPLDDFTYEEVQIMHRIVEAVYRIYTENEICPDGGLLSTVFVAGLMTILSANNVDRFEYCRSFDYNRKVGELLGKGYTVITMWNGKVREVDFDG